jgi:hypothetical protein
VRRVFVEQNEIFRLLEKVASGETSVDDAVLKLKKQPFSVVNGKYNLFWL